MESLESEVAPTLVETANPLAELADRASKRVATGLVIAGAIVGLAVYWKPAPTHFEAFVAGGEVFRLNTKTGTIIACDAKRCMTVVKRGRDLMGTEDGKLFQSGSAIAPAASRPRLPPPGP